MIKIYASLIILILAAALTNGCLPKYKLADLSDDPNIKLDASQSVVISKPRGVNCNIRGSAPTNELKMAFSKHIKNVIISPCSNLEQCLEQAEGKYLVMTDVYQWGDPMDMPTFVHLTDRIEVRIFVINMTTGTTLRSMVFKASSKWARLGGDHPENILEQPIKEFIDSLYIL